MNELQHTLQRSLGVFILSIFSSSLLACAREFKTLDKHAALFQNINFLKDILKRKHLTI
jgi:hypothetical protein